MKTPLKTTGSPAFLAFNALLLQSDFQTGKFYNKQTSSKDGKNTI